MTEKSNVRTTSPNQTQMKKLKMPEGRLIKAALLLLLVFVVGFYGGTLGAERHANQASSSGNTQASQKIVSSESNLISTIAKNVGPSVVSVNVTSESSQTDFFGFSSPSQQQSAGTGFIVSDKGIVVTNRHVVPKGTTQVSVTLSDGTELSSVEVIGRTGDSDPLDIAFLRIKDAKGKKLTPVKLGDSAKVQVGEKVVAIGNALGQFQNTVTSGIISGYGRSVEASDGSGSGGESLQNLFQTDAAINQGNSGGPLVNMNGEVIGINTAIAGSGAQNIGFAIPINDVNGIISNVVDKGKILRPYLGVHFVALNDDYAYQYNLSQKRGAYLAPTRNGQSPVISGSPADKAGLKEKDVIVKIDGTPIDESNSLTSLVGRKSVGDEITLTIVRDGKQQDIKVKLEAAPGSTN